MFPTPLTFMFRAWTTFKNRKCLNVAPHLGLASWTILCKVSRAHSQSTMENKIKRFPIFVWKMKVSKNYFLIFQVWPIKFLIDLVWEIVFPLCNGGLCHLHCGPLHNFACYAIHTFTHPRHSRLILQISELGTGNNGPKLRSRPSRVPSVHQVKHYYYFCGNISMFCPSVQCPDDLTRPDPVTCHEAGQVTGDIPLMTQQNNIWPSITTSHHNTIHREDHTSGLASAWCSVNISEGWKICELR